MSSPEPWTVLPEDAPLRDDGQVCTPEEAWAWSAIAAEQVGVTHVSDLTDTHPMRIPVTQALRPGTTGEVRTMGKGLTRRGAVVGARMEAVERACAELTTDDLAEPRRQADGLPRLPVELLHPLPDAGPVGDVPWLAAADLRGTPVAALPLEMVTLHWRLPLPDWTGRFRASSNGLAAGFTRTTATLQGLCEVVERDAMALWDLAGPDAQAGTRIALSTVTDGRIRALVRAMQKAGLLVAVWDLTGDAGIPVVQAGTLAKDERRLEEGDVPAAGVGCHPDPDVAIIRALCEAAQSRISALHGMDELPASAYDEAADLRARALSLLRQPPARSRQDMAGFATGLPMADLAEVAARAEAAYGQAPLVVDLTRPGLPPVVKVVVPGTESSLRLPGWTPGPRARALLDRVDDGAGGAAAAAPSTTHAGGNGAAAAPAVPADDGAGTTTGASSSPADRPAPVHLAPLGRRNRGPVLFMDRERLDPSADWAGIEIRPAARPGDLVAAVSAGASAVGLVDLDPDPRPRLRCAEGMYVLRAGVPLLGALGMGALISHDLQGWGARTLGSVPAAMTTDGVVDDNAIYRAGDGTDWLTVEATVEVLLDEGILDEDTADAFLTAAATLPWRSRTWPMMARALPGIDEDTLAGAVTLGRAAMTARELDGLADLLRDPPPVTPARPIPLPTTQWQAAARAATR